MSAPTVYQEVERLRAAGISFVPISLGGEKRPAVSAWKPFQKRLPTEAEAQEWFGNGRRLGIALICGAVSGNLEQIDVDAADLEAPFETLAEAAAPGLLARLVKIKTPRPGCRYVYRCEAPVEGNLKLARRQIGVLPTGKPEIKTTIETRGEGGYAVAPGSPPEVHETGRPYELLRGDLAAPPVITSDERTILLDCARALNESVEPEQMVRSATPRSNTTTGELLPGDDYNQRGDFVALLLKYGWLIDSRQGEATYWRRPGKEGKGWSASLDYVAPGVFYVFSSNADPFEVNRGYDAFAVYTLLEHEGDYGAAGKALYAEGFGERVKAEKAPPPGDEDAPTSSGNGNGSHRPIDPFEGDDVGEETAPPREDDDPAPTPKAPPPKPLWKKWVGTLEKEKAVLIWTDATDAYFQLPTGELFAVNSDAAARFFQARTDREARYQSDKWAKAAGALRSWAEVRGKKATVVYQAKVNFAQQIAWIGCEDTRSIYRVTPGKVEIVPNGTDGVLIKDGIAPLLTDLTPTGELARWLMEDTWATPVGRLTMAIFAVMLLLGAQSFPSRPLIMGIGGKGSGKTTRLQMLGGMVNGENSIAQALSPRDDQNEARIVNERFVVLDNLEGAPRNADTAPEDFIASVCTQQVRSIRKMRAEGEQIKKPITAFLAATSFSVPPCLRRADVIERALIVAFMKPDEGRVAEMTDRVPDREKCWADLLRLVQHVVTNWATTPDTSELRSVGFMRIAHALLPADDALGLEQKLLAYQARTAGQDDVILQALDAIKPAEPKTAKELWALWWHVFGDDRPKNPAALGMLLHKRQGRFGKWQILGQSDPKINVTKWSFNEMETGSQGALTNKRASALLEGLVGGRERTGSS